MPLPLLPGEIWSAIALHLPISSLKALRLASPAANLPVARQLFREVILKPDDGSVKRWRCVSHSAELAPYVRSVVIETCPKIEGDLRELTEERELKDWRAPREFLLAMQDIASCFPHATNVSLRLSPYEHSSWACLPATRGEDGPRYQQERLSDLFLGLNARCDTARQTQVEGTEQAILRRIRTVERLTIIQLCTFSGGFLADSTAFQSVLPTLKELHLLIRPGCRSQGPERLTVYGLKNFVPYLDSAWLQPTKDQLTSLSIYFGTPSEAPYLQLVSTPFRNLRSLALGGHVFMYEAQFAFVLGHQTLERLMLENCSIIFLLKEKHRGSEISQIRSEEWRRLPGVNQADPVAIFETSLRWSDFFTRAANELPHLTRFGLGRQDEEPLEDGEFVSRSEEEEEEDDDEGEEYSSSSHGSSGDHSSSEEEEEEEEDDDEWEESSSSSDDSGTYAEPLSTGEALRQREAFENRYTLGARLESDRYLIVDGDGLEVPFRRVRGHPADGSAGHCVDEPPFDNRIFRAVEGGEAAIARPLHGAEERRCLRELLGVVRARRRRAEMRA